MLMIKSLTNLNNFRSPSSFTHSHPTVSSLPPSLPSSLRAGVVVEIVDLPNLLHLQTFLIENCGLSNRLAKKFAEELYVDEMGSNKALTALYETDSMGGDLLVMLENSTALVRPQQRRQVYGGVKLLVRKEAVDALDQWSIEKDLKEMKRKYTEEAAEEGKDSDPPNLSHPKTFPPRTSTPLSLPPMTPPPIDSSLVNP